ncbi:MAG: FAD-dependent oxidoreductase [Sphingobium sp.]
MENLIIGAGVVGMATALEILGRGQSVHVIDSREHEGLGTSYANGGLLTPSMSDPWNTPGVHKHILEFILSSKSALKIRLGAIPSLMTWGPRFLLNSTPRRHEAATLANLALSIYSLKTLDDMRQTYSLDYEAVQAGSMKIFRSQESLDHAARLTDMLGAFGLCSEVADAARAIELEPSLYPIRDEVRGAIFYPHDGVGDAHLFCQAAGKAVRAMGGVMQFGHMVEALHTSGNRITSATVDGNKVLVNRVIVATGVASPALAAALGVRLRIKPVKGYSVTYRPGKSNRLPKMPVIDDAYHTAVTPIGDRLRAAGTAEFAGHDVQMDKRRVVGLANMMQEIFPEMMDKETLAAGTPWAGLRPVSADGRPYIGPGPQSNLWINSGHGHLGWTMAAGSARLLVDLIEGRRTEIDANPYRIDR